MKYLKAFPQSSTIKDYKQSVPGINYTSMKASMPFELKLYRRVNDIPDEVWRETEGDSSITCFHRPEFLYAQEYTLRGSAFNFIYVVITVAGKTCGLAIFQIKNFTVSDMMGDANFFTTKLGRFINRPLIKVVICGDLISSDISGVAFNPAYSEYDRAVMLKFAAEKVVSNLDGCIGILLLKDLPAKTLCQDTVLKAGYFRINLSPTMYINISDKWRDVEDYKNALKSKYRSFTNTAQIDAQALVRKKLDTLTFEKYKHEIENLYQVIYSKAKHKGPYLGQKYFSMLNTLLGETQYDVVGYFDQSSLIGFNTRYYSNDVVDSTFFGMQKNYNIKFQLLKNMILDDLDFAIKRGARLLHLGRTNYQMKSAMGAVAVETTSFVKPLNIFSAPLVSLARYFTAPEKWVKHNPYCAM